MVRFRGGLGEYVLLNTVTALRELLMTRAYDFEKPRAVEFFLTKVIGDGLVTARGERHKRERRLLRPIFSVEKNKSVCPVFWSQAKKSVEEMEKLIDKTANSLANGEHGQNLIWSSPIDVSEWADRLVLEGLGRAAMGASFHALDSQISPVYDSYRLIMRSSGMLDLILMTAMPILSERVVDWLDSCLLRPARGAKRSVLRDSCASWVAERRTKKYLEAETHTTETCAFAEVLDLNEFSGNDTIIVDHIRTFLSTGTQTTATTLTWAIYAMCRYPDVQSRLRRELRSNLSPYLQNTRGISYDALSGLPYLQAVCSEVFRYFPALRRTVRQAITNTTLGGKFIPKGTKVYIPIHLFNRDENLWGKHAGNFNPERWLGDENGGCSTMYANMTFLQGPRNCIGQQLARIQFATILAVWVAELEFEFEDGETNDEEIEDVQGAVLNVPKDFNVKVRRCC